MTAYFVDPSVGNDADDGLDNTGLTLATTTWTASSLTLTQAGAFAAYTYAAGDMIAITGGTGATTGLYQIASKIDANSITLVATTTVPGAQNGATLSGSDLATGDIASSSGPFLTIEQGDTILSAYDTLWMKASATYAYAGTFMVNWGTADNVLEGYTTTPGDGGRVLFDGTVNANTYGFYSLSRSTLVNVIINGTAYGYYPAVAGGCLRNCVVKGFSATGWQGTSDKCIVEDCEFSTSSGAGIRSGWGSVVRRNYFHDLGTGSVASSYRTTFVDNIFDTCTIGIDRVTQEQVCIVGCTFYNCSTAGIQGSNSQFLIEDNIFANCGYGLDNDGTSDYVTQGANSIRGNHWFSNTTDIGSSSTGSWLTPYGENPSTTPGNTSGDPLFTDAPNGDFSLGAGSPAAGIAFEFVSTEVSSGSTTYQDRGAVQQESGGGGLHVNMPLTGGMT